MASTSGIEEDQPNNDQELLDMVKEMKEHIETIETSVQELRALRSTAQEPPPPQRYQTRKQPTDIDEALVTDITELYTDHELLKNAFLRLCNDHFIISPEGVCLTLLVNDPKLALGLKIKIQRLKHQEEHLKSKLELLLAEIYKYKLGNDDEITLQSGESFDDDDPESDQGFITLRSAFLSARLNDHDEEPQEWDPRLLAKKLRIIKHYYLEQSRFGAKRIMQSSRINSGLLSKFAWLRSTKSEVNLDGHPDDGAEFETPDIDELMWQIRGLVRLRRMEKGEAREEGKKSLLEYVIRDGDAGECTALNSMHEKARELGESLSSHVSDMFYLALATGESFHKFKDHLRFVLNWLDEKGKTPVIRRVLDVIRDVEEELYLLDKFQFFPPYSEVPLDASSAQRESMDRVIHTLLAEILRLESIVSYPSLADENFQSVPSVEIKTLKIFKKSLEESEKVVEEIGQEMQILKVMRVFVSEDENEGSVVKLFEDGRVKIVEKAWVDLRVGYIPS